MTNETVQDTTSRDDSFERLSSMGFQNVSDSKYAQVFVNKDRKILVCVLNADYIPIKEFKELFNSLSEYVKQNSLQKFVFDKRTLRTFHQPSMEWYYIEWKTNMLKEGLSLHRKILPDIKWFKKAVEIAKRPLIQKMPKEISDQLDIAYFDSLEEAIEN